MQVEQDEASLYEEYLMHPDSVWGELQDCGQFPRQASQIFHHPPNARNNNLSDGKT